MGYALPASIGAALVAPERQQICSNGDGGIQMNLQELQTVKEYNLDIKVVVFNNHRLGMICQFQDTYMGGRYAATADGPGRPCCVLRSPYPAPRPHGGTRDGRMGGTF